MVQCDYVVMLPCTLQPGLDHTGDNGVFGVNIGVKFTGCPQTLVHTDLDNGSVIEPSQPGNNITPHLHNGPH